MRRLGWLSLLVLAGCQVTIVDPVGKACDADHPCPDGYQCVGGACSAGCGDDRVGHPCSVGLGACAASGNWACTPNGLVCDAVQPAPAAESCDGLDNDCNGTADDVVGGCACLAGQTRACGSDVGACAPGTQGCDGTGTWSSCTGETVATAEQCNGIDDDCDGIVDNAAGCVSTVAGLPPTGYLAGAPMDARFNSPMAMVHAGNGDLYIADGLNHVVRKVSFTTGQVTVVAGIPGQCGFADGALGIGKLCSPSGLALAGDGTLYIADRDNHRVRALIGGALSTYAGTGAQGGTDGAIAVAQLDRPGALALDGARLYVSDTNRCRLRYIEAGSVGTAAGSAGCTGSLNDGAVGSATFGTIAAVVVTAPGTLYVADLGFSRIRRISGGTVTTVAGNGWGFADGTGTAAQFHDPAGLALNGDGTGLYISDRENNRVRFMTLPGMVVTTVAGEGHFGIVDGPAGQAQLAWPEALAFVGGELYVTSHREHRIRKLAGGTLTTVAGGFPITFLDGPPNTAILFEPRGIDYDPATQLAYFADSGNHAIRAVRPDGSIFTVTGGQSKPGFNDGTLATARWNSPTSLKLRADGKLVVADSGNARIRLIDLAGDRVTTLAGGGIDESPCDYVDNVPASLARLCWPSDVALGPGGEVYFTDSSTQTVRKLVAGVVSRVAGAPWTGGWVNGTADTTRFDWPNGIVYGSDGFLYVADSGRSRIRKVNPTTGDTTTVGGGSDCDEADGTPTTGAVCWPTGLLFEGSDLLVVSSAGGRLRRLNTTVFDTIAGQQWGYGYADGALLQALFNEPWGVSRAPGGGYYVTDQRNHRIRRVMP